MYIYVYIYAYVHTHTHYINFIELGTGKLWPMGWLVLFVNKVLLAPAHTHSFTNGPWQLVCFRGSAQRLYQKA